MPSYLPRQGMISPIVALVFAKTDKDSLIGALVFSTTILVSFHHKPPST